MTTAVFEVDVLLEQARTFAELSGDWNPLHTDAAYAATTQYRRPILHGAFSAGLVSRMAGMHIPGRDCLLHSIHLKFLAPIVPPTRLVVRGTLLSESSGNGSVDVTITDATSGVRLVNASYEFGRHSLVEQPSVAAPATVRASSGAVVLVTGPSGAIGSAVLRQLGAGAVGFSLTSAPAETPADTAARILALLDGRAVSAIVHCGWPAPDNTRLTRLDDLAQPIAHHVATPLTHSVMLARVLATTGTPDAVLVLLGSTAADPGRHNFRSPLYSLSKSLLPLLSRILAVELGGSGRRCVTVAFDVVDAGMNEGMSPQARAAHKGRIPSGTVPSANEVAEQITWILGNRSSLISGATLTLSGGALP